MMPIDVQTDKEGKQYFAAAVGNVMLQDTGKFLNYLQLDAVKIGDAGRCEIFIWY